MIKRNRPKVSASGRQRLEDVGKSERKYNCWLALGPASAGQGLSGLACDWLGKIRASSVVEGGEWACGVAWRSVA
jgi:hypothetical protein